MCSLFLTSLIHFSLNPSYLSFIKLLQNHTNLKPIKTCSNFQTYKLYIFTMLQEPSSSSSKWIITNSTKLQIFIKMRRFFLNSKKPTNKQPSLSHSNQLIINPSLDSKTQEITHNNNNRNEKGEMALQKAVKELLFGTWDEKESAVKVIISIASHDFQTRKALAELGVIPPLVSMLGSDVVSRRWLAVQALTHLADGSFTNKALILEAGILSKLPSEVDKIDEPTRHGISELLFSISSLSNTQFPLNPSKLLPFLLNNLQSNSTSEKTKESCLGTLYNLSAVIENSAALISNQVVNILLTTLSSSKEKITEIALATLGNLVVTLMGKKALEDNSMVPESLIDILTWEENPKCQELSVYVLMVLGHQSGKQRDKMAKAGIVHVLLEVALLGSPLAQKRAIKLLQWFKDERRVSVGPHSGPMMTRQLSMGSPAHETGNSEGKRLMKRMVQQSLYKNMEVITRRANAQGESSKFKSLVISSSSKSLPY